MTEWLAVSPTNLQLYERFSRPTNHLYLFKLELLIKACADHSLIQLVRYLEMKKFHYFYRLKVSLTISLKVSCKFHLSN